ALLTATIVIPALIFAVVLLERNNQAQEGMVTALAEATAASITPTIERNFTGLETNLRIFATASSLEAGALVQFHARAVKALEGTENDLAGFDEHLDQLFDTRVPFGAPSAKIAEIETVRQVIASGEPAVTGVSRNEETQKWAFSIMLPLNPAEGAV